ncbi:neutral zinc metallopeptidase [Streptomyces violaceus]
MHDFLEYAVKDVDAFWSEVWATAGYPKPQTSYAFPGPGEVSDSACGPSDDAAAWYCSIDDHLVVSQVKATQIWEGTFKTNEDPDSGYPAGDFSVAYAVAHEYAHHLQDELGIIPSSENEPRRFPVYKTELHADCWAGIWANSTFHRGLLEAGDIHEAVKTTLDIGGYNFEDVQFHGTPEQRRGAFLAGWDSGVPAECDTYLLRDY